MAAITYGTDVAPHLQRGLTYRRLRIERWKALHRHVHCDSYAYDPYGWAETATLFDLVIAMIVIVFLFVADSEAISRSR